MYSEINRRSGMRRSDGEFLRRMLGGNLSGDALPAINGSATLRNDGNKPSPDAQKPVLPELDPNRPRCDGSDSESVKTPADEATGGRIPAPALAMVYAPKQRWTRLLTPEEGLKAGSLFADLIFPLESVPAKRSSFRNETEVTRRPS